MTTETKEERIGKRKEWMRTGDRRGRMVRSCTECGGRTGSRNMTGLCMRHRFGRDLVFDKVVRVRRSRYRLSDILSLTSTVFQVPVEEVLSNNRQRRLARPRQCISLVARRLCPHLSSSQIGRALKRDHSTILHNAALGEYLFETDDAFSRNVIAVVAALAPASRFSLQVKRRPAAPLQVSLEKPAPKPVAAPAPAPNNDDEFDEMAALSLAVQQHYASGRDCIEVY